MAYYKLAFLDKDQVALKRAFNEILPLLRLKSGAMGSPPTPVPPGSPTPAFMAPPGNPFAVLLDEDRSKALLAALEGRSGLRCIFIVTDSQDAFRDLSAQFSDALDAASPALATVQLYRDYLDNFRINAESAGARAVVGETGQCNALYDRHKQAIGKLKEKERQRIQRLRRATAEPVEEPWMLPERIDCRRPKTAPLYERHWYLEADGGFRAELETWERELVAEESLHPAVVGRLRNLPRKPWSLEIPYESGGALKPMFPDRVIVRAGVGGAPRDYRFDILEPHNWRRSKVMLAQTRVGWAERARCPSDHRDA